MYRYFFSFILLFFFFLFFRALTGVNHVDVISLASTNRDKLDATYILFRPCYTTAANESRPGERPLSSPCCESVCRHHVDHVRGSVSQIVWQPWQSGRVRVSTVTVSRSSNCRTTPDKPIYLAPPSLLPKCVSSSFPVLRNRISFVYRIFQRILPRIFVIFGVPRNARV